MASSANSSCVNLSRARPYVGLMLGASGVGKTSLIHQFMTSDYMNAYDASLGRWYIRVLSFLAWCCLVSVQQTGRSLER